MKFTQLRSLAIALAIAALPGPISTARAYDEASTAAVNVDTSGFAVKGYDPVAYFTAGSPTPGKDSFTAEHAGAKYRFASAANRDAFSKDPGKYAPQYGGFCAMGAAMGFKLDGNPNIWKVVDNKLYLNVHEKASQRWNEDVPGNIAKANNNWPTIASKAPKDLK